MAVLCTVPDILFYRFVTASACHSISLWNTVKIESRKLRQIFPSENTNSHYQSGWNMVTNHAHMKMVVCG